MANKTLNVTSLDRPSIRQDLIDFLKGNPQFLDYDFVGSNLSLLVDLLSYNTNKLGFLVNMLFSEAFLDSSQLRSSAVSHAKELGYTPRSARSSSANVTVTFQATGENQPYIIKKGESFSTLIKNTQYVFTVPETLVVASSNSTFSFSTPIYEGEYFKDAYVYNPTTDEPFPTFRISNPNVDTTSLTVVAFGDDSVIGQTYTLATSLLDLNNLSTVYFLQCTTDGYYEVLFGDGVVGKTPTVGSRIILDYRVTVGSAADSASRFAINFDPSAPFREASQISVITTGNSTGGADAESISSIQFYAPRWFQTQEKAAPAQDYETLLRSQFPEIKACTAYGGEDANPPLYGRVVISIYIPGFSTIPSSRQSAYEQFLIKRMPTGMKPYWVDPNFTFVEVNTTVNYDTSVTANTPERIKSLVTSVITKWNETNLTDFASQLLYSPFTTAIDQADPSIVSNDTEIRLYKKLTPLDGVQTTQSLDFQLALVSDQPPMQYPHATSQETVITSSSFTWNGLTVRFEDDGQGKVLLVQDSNGYTSKVSEVGTVDYSTGVINMTYKVDSYPGTAIQFYATSEAMDVASQKNTILIIEPSGIFVTPKPVTK